MQVHSVHPFKKKPEKMNGRHRHDISFLTKKVKLIVQNASGTQALTHKKKGSVDTTARTTEKNQKKKTPHPLLVWHVKQISVYI